MSRHIAIVVTMILLSVFAAPAGAQNTTAVARRLFGEGLEASERGEWELAYTRFKSARELAPDNVNVTFNLAIAAEKTGRLVAAQEYYRSFLGKTRDSVDAQTQSRREVATADLTKIDKRVGTLRLTIRNLDHSVDEVTLNDDVLSKLMIGQVIPVDPTTPEKPHRVSIRRSTKELLVRRIVVNEGQSVEETIVLEPYVPPKPVPTQPQFNFNKPTRDQEKPTGGSSIASSPWFWVGVAVVAVGAGGVFYGTQIYTSPATDGNAGDTITVR